MFCHFEREKKKQFDLVKITYQSFSVDRINAAAAGRIGVFVVPITAL